MFQSVLIIYLISINLIGFFICLIDKIKSIKNWYRISEKSLLLISLFGGCFGMAFSMSLFRHKTKKMKFKLVYLFCGIYIYLFSIYIYLFK